jgi:hypothetical protein
MPKIGGRDPNLFVETIVGVPKNGNTESSEISSKTEG